MSKTTVQASIEAMLHSGLATPATMQGCSSAHLQALAPGHTLPQAYRQFMLAAGHATGQFMQGSDFHCAAVPGLREAAQKVLAANHLEKALTANDFIFLGHQGYQFLWFDVRAGDDPPVHMYVDGDEGPTQIAEHFSTWLAQATQDEIDILKSLSPKSDSK